MLVLWQQWTVAAAVIVALLTSRAAAQVQAAPPKIEWKGERVSVPIDTATQHIVVKASLNENGPFEFVMDTGAGMTLLDQRLADRLHLETIGEARVGDATTGEPKTMKIVMIDRIDIGGAVLTGKIPCVVQDLSELFSGEPDRPMGILGFRLFENCLLTLDYPGNALVLEHGALPDPDGKSILPCKRDRGLPVIETQLGGIDTKLTIDTGAATNIVLEKSLKDKYHMKAPPVVTRTARRMNTETEIAEARIDGDLKFGAYALHEPFVHFEGTRSVVGYDVLSNFALTFDQKNERVRFQRADAKPITFGPRYAWGMTTKFNGDHREVLTIVPGSPAEKAGLKVGDMIRAANGKLVTELPRQDWAKLSWTAGKVELVVDRGTQKTMLTLDVAVVVP